MLYLADILDAVAIQHSRSIDTSFYVSFYGGTVHVAIGNIGGNMYERANSQHAGIGSIFLTNTLDYLLNKTL